ncbi:MAG TPA: aminotransferase class I/II-fold pyridoxal phosphate-dependent enzyme [Phycisphaerales bacterium]|nr:aminotransferase class I/II-fold pyridoxal phosphate-dependent enzyme [Phycisphaerales bacterium]
MRTSQVADRLAPFGTTIFTEMTRLAAQHGAVNLAQGFPDFDGPELAKEAAIAAIQAGRNQYARMLGDPALNAAIAARWQRSTGQAVDPDAQVTVTSGCTEAIPATILGLINPGETVVLFEPFYDSYRACISMAGARARFVTLRAPASGDGPFTFDEAELRKVMAERPRAILLNTPHNPTGKVFSRMELELIARLCIEHDVLAITDEVYSELVYEAELPHISLASLPGMAERTVTLNSLGKSYSLTGWKIGWAIAPAELTRGVRAAHQFLTFATCTPMQLGAARILLEGDGYIRELVAEYRRKRDMLAQSLRELGMGVYVPAGSYFIMADHSALGFENDVDFCRHLTEHVKVAAIPPSVFYDNPEHGKRLARFAFCKKDQTLREAIHRLGALKKR